MSNIDSDEVDLAVEQYLRHLHTGDTPPSLHGLDEERAAEARQIFRLLDACWEGALVEIPAIEDDPLAVELGLVSKPRRVLEISGTAVKAARRKRGLNIKQVAEALAARGHPVSTAWAFDLERSAASALSNDAAEALAEVLGVSLVELSVAAHSEKTDSLSRFRKSKVFADVVGIWARVHHLDPEVLGNRVVLELARAPRRSHGEPDEDDWKRMLVGLLESWKE